MTFLRLLLSFLFFSLFSAQVSLSQTDNSLRTEAKLLIETLKKKHYSPCALNDEFSKELFENFILSLDPHKIYFREADIKTIQGYKTLLDKEVNGGSWGFLPKFTTLYKERLIATEKLFTQLLQKPFNYKSVDTISLSHTDTFSFAKSDQEYLARCTRFLKYQTVLRLALSAPKEKTSQQVLAGESLVREQIKIIESRKIKRILEHPMGYENYVASVFFNTITSAFDPHTAYLHKTEFENFRSHLSREGFSFGIELEETDAGEIAIDRLVPGGPAWKSNAIHKGDVLIKLKWASKNEVDLTGADLDEVEELLSESNSEKLEFTFRKVNGLITTTGLVKEKLEEDANIVKSFILSDEKKIGYLSLPDFYTEWDDFSGLGCANDVAREIVRLKAENVDGIILDLRFNGGGSLTEALNLIGIFINEGPLMVIQMREGKPLIMKDMNRGTVYDGPLVLMVNGLSASASEIVASTLQDYNRAVIVGSSTYGKATGQILLPLDSTISQMEMNDLRSPYGVAKITVEKLYRVNGKSAQLKGVSPDVCLPDIYEGFDFREVTNPNALANDSIVKKIFYTPLKPLPLKELALKSQERIRAEEQFRLIGSLSGSYKKLMKDFENFPLILDTLRSRNNALVKFSNDFEDAGKKDSTQLRVENLKDEKEVLQMDNYKKEIDALIKENLKQDIFIQESYYIISDLINLTTN